MKKLSARLLPLAVFALFATPLTPATAAESTVVHPAWTRSANIYEVNLRQYTQEGSLNAFAKSLPRLQKMGVDILWLMPIHPIGERNRKGSLGSYYAARDYLAVAPEYGSLDDLRALVKQAHGLGMKVMLDWVGNHTAWDHPWTTAHPDWYKKNAQGEIYPVTFRNEAGGVEEWTDVVALDYDNRELWQGMTDAMAFWVREADIDGFRCDAAGLVPTAFWDQARATLDRIKPMFMLAEWDEPALHQQAFDMTYDWPLSHLMKDIAQGKAGVPELRKLMTTPPKVYPASAYRMRFTNNHDINSWDGTDRSLYGPAYQAMAVLSFTLPGMPLIYGGQEAGLDKQLAFFEKDPIDWSQLKYADFYTRLIALKHRHPALWNGTAGAPLQLLDPHNAQVFAFRRQQGSDQVTVAVNLSGIAQRYTLPGAKPASLPAWGWRISAPTAPF